MTTFNQFFGTGDKLGEVILMANSDFPSSFSAGGASFLKDATSIINPNGLYDEYISIASAGAILNQVDGTLPIAVVAPAAQVIKKGANYLIGCYYTTDVTSTWTLGTGGSTATNFGNCLIGTNYCTTYGTKVAYSSDGTSYTEVSLTDTGNLIAANTDATLAVTVSYYGTGDALGDIYTSTDGVTWTARTPSVTIGAIRKCFWSPTLSAFVYKNSTGDFFKTTDGYTMSTLTLPGSGTSRDIVDTGTTLYASYSSNLYSSPDGTTWTLVGPMGVSASFLYYAGGILFAYTSYYTRCGISTDNGVSFIPLYFTRSDDGVYGQTTSFSGVCTIDGEVSVIMDTELIINPIVVPNAVYADIIGTPDVGTAYTRIL